MYFKKEYFPLPAPSSPAPRVRIYTAWDFAIGEKQANDWTVGATILRDELDQLYVLEIFRMKGTASRSSRPCSTWPRAGVHARHRLPAGC